MHDFKFIKSNTGGWVISAPKRGHKPDQATGEEPDCPFEMIDGKIGDEKPVLILNQVKVIPNHYPFASIHEVVIHSDDHRRNLGELDYSLAEDVFKVFQLRFQKYRKYGQVYIFHNFGKMAGASLPHPHSQLTLIPFDVELEVPPLRLMLNHDLKMLSELYIFCPSNSAWPDEVWVAPKREGGSYSDASADQIRELSFIVSRLIQIYTMRYENDFPFNFYIYPGDKWYLRIIPRLKTLGGFEIGTNVSVNTQNPHETFKFIEENFDDPNFEKIKAIHQAHYRKSV